MSAETPAAGTPVPAAQPENAVRLDGLGRDPLWARAVALPPFGFEDGQKEDAARKTLARLVQAGPWLCFALEAAEPDGLVAREGMHGSALWLDDTLAIALKGARELRVFVNPLGTVWCQVDGKDRLELLAERKVCAAVRILDGRWRAEVAVDLAVLLGDPAKPGRIEARAMRQRQQRGLTAYEETACPAKNHPPLALETQPARSAVPLDAGLPEPFAGRALLEAGRCAALPADAAGWARMPAQLLRDESGLAPVDPAHQATAVRAALTDEALALLVVCKEAHLDHLDEKGEQLWQEDNVEVFAGPEGYPYLQLAAGPAGKTQAARGKTGGRRVKTMKVPEGVTVHVAKGADAWSVALVIPFAVFEKVMEQPARLHPDVFPWRIQISRNRSVRKALGQAQQYSVLAVTHSSTSHCPLRFASLRPVRPTAEAVKPEPFPALDLPAAVLTPQEREQLQAATLVRAWTQAKSDALHRAWEDEFERIEDAEGWNALAAKVRANLLQALFPATGGQLPERGALNAEAVYEQKHDGFRVVGLIYESQPGLPVPVTLYIPPDPPKPDEKRPALLIVPAHHTPRNSTDVEVLGANVARAGGVALAIESMGSGERSVSARWEHKNYQRNLLGQQLMLAGEELAGWIAFDISRAVDYLLARGDVDPERIGIVGGVAGGGDISSVAAAVDERIGVSIPFNFSKLQPFGAFYDPARALAGSHHGGYTPWMTDALVAPRRLIQAQEFAWTEPCQASYARFQKVYGWLGAETNLNFLHGGVETHATHFAALHRRPLYHLLNQWWSISLPTKEGEEHLPKLDHSSLECFQTPKGREYLGKLRDAKQLREPHVLARESAAQARAAQDAATLHERLAKLLGEIEPHQAEGGAVQARALADWRGAKVEGLWLPAEAPAGEVPAIGIALWVLKPAGVPEGQARPAVLGLAQAGKARFLAERAADVQRLLEAGIAVALADLRGCGETSPGPSRYPEAPSAELSCLLRYQNESLPARQLMDARTVLAYLARRADVDGARLALWGEGFSAPNAAAGEEILFDETGFRQSSPQPLRLAEPLGGWLALAAALFPIQDEAGKQARPKAVLARGTLASFDSVLERRHHYIPEDAIVPGFLRMADSGSLAAALRAAGVALGAEDLRDGSNRVVSAEALKAAWGEAAPAGYASFPTPTAMAELIRKLKE